jgi:hypothetical protein
MSNYILGQQPPTALWKFNKDKNQLFIEANNETYPLGGSGRN